MQLRRGVLLACLSVRAANASQEGSCRFVLNDGVSSLNGHGGNGQVSEAGKVACGV